MSKTLDEKQQFIELRARGYSFAKISLEIKVSKATLIEWSKEESLVRDIHNQKTLLMDELQEKYAITKRHRVEVFGEVLNKLKEELSKRDLSTLSTDKLIGLTIKLSDTLKQDETDLELMGEREMPMLEMFEEKRWRV